MMAGMDRYYQIARCFRDEDLRADRQPDSPSSTWSSPSSRAGHQDYVGLIRDVFREVRASSWPRRSAPDHAEAMRRYGSDKPDLRIALELVDVATLVKDCEFKVFSSGPATRKAAWRPCACPAARACRASRSTNRRARGRHGAKGLAWMRVDDVEKKRDGINSPIAKFLDDATSQRCCR
jgi:aspartyl-tRNA synthetase